MTRKELVDLAQLRFSQEWEEFAKKVAPFYQVMSWEWSDKLTDECYTTKIPTEADILSQTIDLVESLIHYARATQGDLNSVSTETGGIIVMLTLVEDKDYVEGRLIFSPVQQQLLYEGSI